MTHFPRGCDSVRVDGILLTCYIMYVQRFQRFFGAEFTAQFGLVQGTSDSNLLIEPPDETLRHDAPPQRR